MIESVGAIVLFWLSFGYTPGPFWLATMEYAASGIALPRLVWRHFVYLLAGWSPQLVFMAWLTYRIGEIDPALFLALHIIGAGVLVHFGAKILRKRALKAGKFSFTMKDMFLLSLTNPKAWGLIPVGALFATDFSDNSWRNIAVFVAISIPIMSASCFFWGYMGQLGAKISFRAMGYVTSSLLFGFALYLLIIAWGLFKAL